MGSLPPVSKERANSLWFARFFCTSGFAEGTPARKSSNFIWYFARLFVPLHPNSETLIFILTLL